MQRPVCFRGKSGRVYGFRQVDPASQWMMAPGVALFAAPEGAAWRVIRIAEMTGRAHDVQPIWAQADARRYGGDAVLVYDIADAAHRREIAADLEAGLSPVWSGRRGGIGVSLRVAA